MTFRKFFLIISIIGCMALQAACDNSVAEETAAVEQEGDIAEETEGTESPEVETGEPEGTDAQLKYVSQEEETTVSKEEMPEETKTIITNPPYSLAKEFVEHSMDLLDNDEYCIMLLKIQFLEGKARKELFKKYPPKFVLVFSERQKCLKNDKDTGGSSAVCYCWFIWQKGFNGKPLIDWL